MQIRDELFDGLPGVEAARLGALGIVEAEQLALGSRLGQEKGSPAYRSVQLNFVVY